MASIDIFFLCNGICIAILLLAFFRNLLFKKLAPKHAQMPPVLGNPVINIAYISSDLTDIETEHCARSLEKQLNQSSQTHRYQVEPLAGKNITDLTRKHLYFSLEQNYELVVSHGLFATQIACDILGKRPNGPHLIYGNIRSNQFAVLKQIPFIQEATGLLTRGSSISQIKKLLYLTPEIDDAHIAYTPAEAEDLSKERDAIQKLLHTHRIKTTIHSITPESDITQSLFPIIENNGLLIIIRNGLTRSQLNKTIDFCNKKSITLALIDHMGRAGVAAGAAIGFEPNKRFLAKKLQEKIALVIEHHILPRNLTVTEVEESYTVCINAETSRQQNLSINENILFLMKHGKIQSGERAGDNL